MSRLAARFHRARTDPEWAVLEGFHALKHAVRFGAEVDAVLTSDRERLAELGAELAPDVAGRLLELAVDAPRETVRDLSSREPHTRVVALARRPPFALADVVAARDAPAILLEDPRNMWNVGAAVRVAAAGAAAGVVTVGERDPWDPSALRGSAGLHFALPVGRVERLDLGGRPLVALDPEGDPLDPGALDADAVLAFGSERHGIGDKLLARADARVRIPMRAGVSSLNLATSVAVALFAWRLGGVGD